MAVSQNKSDGSKRPSTLTFERAELVAIGQRVRAGRVASGLTQQELADLTGLHRVTINRFETGQLDPRLSNVLTASRALNIPIAVLLG